MATYSASPPYGGSQPSVVYVAPAPVYMGAGDASQIHDWLIWSIINIFVGWGGGLLPLIFLLCAVVTRTVMMLQVLELLAFWH
ncbi:hypothetical protein I4U23_012287 [Adineta vaga]|nr:hypothetical protein I4U23_012287 [Adineta vaga]